MSGERQGLLRAAIGRPVTVTVGALLVVLFGALSVRGLPIQLTPDISAPTLQVSTHWPGGSPTEIEAEVLERQEDALKSLPGLVRMTSSARPDWGNLTLELEVGIDIDEALVRASNRLGQVGGYPEAARDPTIETADSSGPPVIVLAVRSTRGEAVAPYRTWVEDSILPEIQRISGIGNVRLIGGRDTIFRIDYDPAEVAARGLTIPGIAARIRDELADVSGGDVDAGRRRLLVRTMAVGATPEAMNDILLGAGADGTPIRVADVGRATIALREAAGVAFSDERPSLIMLIDRESGSNVLELTREVRERVRELDEERFRVEGLRLEVLSDQVDYIEGSLRTVRNNLIAGGLLAITALFLFLRALGPSLLVSLTIPICGFFTVLGMTLFGRSVNVVSLAGITFAVGMVLDNSIVALESIDVWRSKIADTRRAAHEGIREVWGAILASTATTSAVFVPVIAWEGEVGQLLRDVAVAISFAIGASLLVSIFVIPSLASKLPPKRESNGDKFTRGLDRFRSFVGRGVARVVASRLASALVVVAAITSTSAIAFSLLPPLEYLPIGNRNLVFGILVPPPGTSVAELDRVARQVQGAVAEHVGVETDGAPAVERSFFVGSPERLFGGATAADPARIKDLETWLRGVQASIPGFHSFTTQASLFGRRGGGRSIELDLSGSSVAELVAVGGRLMLELQNVLPGGQVRPEPSLDPGALELRAHPRRGPAAAFAPTTQELGLIVSSLVDGAMIGERSRDGDAQLDVLLRARRRSGSPIEDADAIASAPVVTPTGEIVPLGVLVDFREELGPTVIRRIERRRALTLQIGPPDDIPLETALLEVRAMIDRFREDGTLPAHIGVGITGTAGDLEIAKVRFAEVLLLALIICYLLMSALFEDFLAPIVILVTLPLAAAGGVIGLRLVDAFLAPQRLDLMTALGFLILIGVVVNNAILVVEGAIARLREGEALEAAIRSAVEARVRPILMTTATSLAGLLPMVLVPGAGSELYRGVGAILLGGLALSTILTLAVVPAFFSLVWRARRRLTWGAQG